MLLALPAARYHHPIRRARPVRNCLVRNTNFCSLGVKFYAISNGNQTLTTDTAQRGKSKQAHTRKRIAKQWLLLPKPLSHAKYLRFRCFLTMIFQHRARNCACRKLHGHDRTTGTARRCGVWYLLLATLNIRTPGRRRNLQRFVHHFFLFLFFAFVARWRRQSDDGEGQQTQHFRRRYDRYQIPSGSWFLRCRSVPTVPDMIHVRVRPGFLLSRVRYFVSQIVISTAAGGQRSPR